MSLFGMQTTEKTAQTKIGIIQYGFLASTQERIGVIQRWDRRYDYCFLNGTALPMVSDRSARSVFLSPKYAIKITAPWAEYQQHEVERAVWQALQPEDRKFFAPLRDYGNGWTVQGRITQLLKGDAAVVRNPFAHKQAEELFDKYRLRDLQWNWEQFGVNGHNGRLIIHDYGVVYDEPFARRFPSRRNSPYKKEATL